MSWPVLIVAAVFEVVWAVGLTYSDGLSDPLPSLATGVAIVLRILFDGAASVERLFFVSPVVVGVSGPHLVSGGH
jgi:quaternary ammonium compound-resistance protein SugE